MSDLRIIIVTGLPGTGKTTLARAWGACYRVPVLSKDAIKEPLLELLGAPDVAESRRLSDASFAALFAVVRELVVASTSLVLEGNFRPGEHEQALLAALRPTTHGISTATLAQVLCTMDEHERLSRLSSRRSDPLRHPGHRDAEQSALPPRAGGNEFLDLPGERFVHTGRNGHEVRAELDRWWNSRTDSTKNPVGGDLHQ
jgi:predicted kinase